MSPYLLNPLIPVAIPSSVSAIVSHSLARNSVSIPEHETPGGAIREWPYYGKHRPALERIARG